MIKQIVEGIAHELGVKITDVRLIGGMSVGVPNAGLLNIRSGRHEVNMLVFDAELTELKTTSYCGDRLQVKINGALSRLQLLVHRSTRD